MKRLALLALLLAPASLRALGDMPAQDKPDPPSPPSVIVVDDGGQDKLILIHEPPTPPAPPAPPWARPTGEDQESREFRHGVGATTSVKTRLKETVRRAKAIFRPARPTATSTELKTIEGELSGTPERAVDSAYRKLDEAVAAWVGPEVPRSWKAPRGLVRKLVQSSPEIKKIEKDFKDVAGVENNPKRDVYTLYQATLQGEFSAKRRAEIVRAYESQVVGHRLGILGVVLAFILTCLGAVVGYVRADEATKGFYTNRLRVLALAAVGAASLAAYRLLS